VPRRKTGVRINKESEREGKKLKSKIKKTVIVRNRTSSMKINKDKRGQWLVRGLRSISNRQTDTLCCHTINKIAGTAGALIHTT
jgi:hypothetical protein